ncbi:MAG: zf-TFIIB domain-containing protein [Pseudomonadota bacterium]
MSSINRKCPVDGAELIEADYYGVIVDQCPVCQGIFCDRGELETIINKAARPLAAMRSKRKQLTQIVIKNQAMTKATTGYRPCPADSVGMEHYERFGVAVDICPMCGGVWLDHGELQMIISLAACYLVRNAHPDDIDTTSIPLGNQPERFNKRRKIEHRKSAQRNFIEGLSMRSHFRSKGAYELDMPTRVAPQYQLFKEREQRHMKRLDRKLAGRATRTDAVAGTTDQLRDSTGFLGMLFDLIE